MSFYCVAVYSGWGLSSSKILFLLASTGCCVLDSTEGKYEHLPHGWVTSESPETNMGGT